MEGGSGGAARGDFLTGGARRRGDGAQRRAKSAGFAGSVAGGVSRSMSLT